MTKRRLFTSATIALGAVFAGSIAANVLLALVCLSMERGR